MHTRVHAHTFCKTISAKMHPQPAFGQHTWFKSCHDHYQFEVKFKFVTINIFLSVVSQQRSPKYLKQTV